jgi:hypothetical protein
LGNLFHPRVHLSGLDVVALAYVRANRTLQDTYFEMVYEHRHMSCALWYAAVFGIFTVGTIFSENHSPQGLVHCGFEVWLWHAVRGTLVRSLPIELSLEDGARDRHRRVQLPIVRAVAASRTCAVERAHKARDAAEGAEPCSAFGRRSRINSHSAEVAGPTPAASWRIR